MHAKAKDECMQPHRVSERFTECMQNNTAKYNVQAVHFKMPLRHIPCLTFLHPLPLHKAIRPAHPNPITYPYMLYSAPRK